VLATTHGREFLAKELVDLVGAPYSGTRAARVGLRRRYLFLGYQSPHDRLRDTEAIAEFGEPD
jgi:hypothetical protein